METFVDGHLPLLFGQSALDAMVGAADANVDYWRLFLECGPTLLAPNLDTLPGIVSLGSSFSPVTVNHSQADNSYPCSLLTQYVSYPLGEMRLLNGRLARLAARAGLNGLGAILKFGEIDRLVQWNSWLMSTNLLPPLSAKALEVMTGSLIRQFPQHAILVKNIHGRENPALPELFLQGGYQLLASRKVYFFDGKPAAFLSRSSVKQDLSALRNLKDYTQVEHHEFSSQDAPRIARLYEMLYLEKHSRFNPGYTPFFVRKALEKRALEFRGLRHSSGRIDAVFACFRQGNVTVTPFVGYDTSMAREPGFYRILVAMLLKRVAEEGTLLNYSSGAGDFKRRRGGEGCIEFNAVYTKHLSPERRLPFLLLEQCAKQFGRRFLEGSAV